jgi:hypothetical protein
MSVCAWPQSKYAYPIIGDSGIAGLSHRKKTEKWLKLILMKYFYALVI